MCRKRIRRAAEDKSSTSESEASDASLSDISFEAEEAASDAESDGSGDVDASGTWDDADVEQYNQVSPTSPHEFAACFKRRTAL